MRMSRTSPPSRILNLQSIPDGFFDFKNCLIEGLICTNLMDRCVLKFQVGAPGMTSTYVILWFLFTAGRIPQKSNFQRGIKIDNHIWRWYLSVQPCLGVS